ncbi:MAG: AMP-binding protein [Firmicutes bacterium]|nr:AMP-binding protein [Bacillota bacterium]
MENKRHFIYETYIDAVEDAGGRLQSIDFKNIESFNFAFDIVDKLAEQQPDKLAMLHIAKNKRKREFTFEDMSKYSSKAAAYFQSLGIGKGDRVMLVMKRHYQFWFAILGLHKLGAVAIPATNLMKQHDFEYRFKAAGVKAIVCTADDNVAYQVELAMETVPEEIIKIIVRGKREGWNSFDSGIQQFSGPFVPEQRACGKEPSIMFFTSGTTGYPKIAIHDFLYPLGHFITAKYWHQVDPDGIHFTISDTGWGKALWGKLYGQWLCEAAVFTYDMDSFDAGEIMDMIARYQITTFCAAPTVYRMMIKKDFSKYDFSHLKHVTTAGEALNAEVFNQFKKVTGLSLHEGFGQTEMTLAVGTLKGMEPKAGSMGKPTPLYDVELLGEDGRPVPAGEKGEIVIRTGKKIPIGLFDGYYRSKELTRQAWNNGIYHTGDTAWKDEDGYYWYVGRDDDVIKSAGYRIGPFEIESVLMELPYVLECGVTSIPGKIRGQVIKACIVLVEGIEGTDDLKKEIQRYARKKMASYKYPRYIEFWEELPKTISGKIQHNKLKG